MKTNKILTVLCFLLLPAMAFAQNWAQDTTFVPSDGETWAQTHGVAVDGEGKIWVQPYSATGKVVVNRDIGEAGPDTLAAQVIYVYNADGTPASFSPVSVLVWADGTTPNDTLGRFWDPALGGGEGAYDTRSGRGITADNDGNIIASQWKTLFKIDYQTGEALAKVESEIGAFTEATVDASGNVYVGAVSAADQPIVKYDSNLENPQSVITTTAGYSRDLQVSPDGNTIWWAGYTGPGVLRYTRPEEFSGFGAVPDTLLRGLDVEAFDLHPQTQFLWVGSGGIKENVPDAPWTPQTLYAFDYADLDPETTPTPVDSIHWVAAEDVLEGFDSALPRGIDFSADGKTAYFAAYNATETDIDLQKFTTDQLFTSIDDRISSKPEGFKLDQNYPNPFNPTTNINYTLDQAGVVTLKVYDITGREVATLVNTRENAGQHTVTFDATNLASGVYIYSLNTNGIRLTNRMTLIK